MSTRRRQLSLALALLLALVPWAATAAPDGPPQEPLSITKLLDWLANLNPLELVSASETAGPHLDPDGNPVAAADDPQFATSQPPDDGGERSPHLDPDG
jgi:hypothetical protein